MSGKPYCYECGTIREYCDCPVYDALADDDDLLDENLAAIAAGSREGHDSEAWRGAKQARAAIAQPSNPNEDGL